jgi:hypothetical protein
MRRISEIQVSVWCIGQGGNLAQRRSQMSVTCRSSPPVGLSCRVGCDFGKRDGLHPQGRYEKPDGPHEDQADSEESGDLVRG